MTTAFVLSGGASLGAVQVGMLQALAEHDVQPDFLIGTSVGAVNAAWAAGHPGLGELDGLEAVWRSLRTRDVFPLRPLLGFLGFIGRRDHLVPLDGLRHVLERNLTFRKLEDAPVPLHVVATEVTTGLELLISRGDAVEALLASAAIPGVFPPVLFGGRYLMDGGVADNTPISHAVGLGAQTVYVLPTGFACARNRPPRRALAMALHAVGLLVQQRLVADVERYEDTVDLRVIQPPCPIDISPTDFSEAAQLIERSRDATRKWLDQPPPGRGQARLLAFHRHEPSAGRK